MNMEDLKNSLLQYNSQLSMVNEALQTTKDDKERQSLLSLKSDLNQLIHLTQESLTTLISKENDNTNTDTNESDQIDQNEYKKELDDEYALFMQEMVNTGAYDNDGQTKAECSKNNQQESSDDSDIEDELATLLGMKCAVLHTHRWGGQPTLHNAMVSAVIPRQDDDHFKDLQVRVLFTHPTHTEMLPCPYYLNGECKFSDEQCRYCHGELVHLSNLKEAIEPDFDSIRIGSTILLKLKWPEDEDITLIKKSTEKYHLWHRAIVKNVDLQKRMCTVKLEQGAKTGEKRKCGTDEYNVNFEDVFPLNTEDDADDNDSLSDTEYPESKTVCSDVHNINHALLVEKSLQNNVPAMGEWERHTRGIGSKLMLAMGYVPGTGLGSGGDGRLQPVEARVLPVGKSLDHCMAISEKAAGQDPLKIEQKLKRLQKKEEERNKRAYEREKEKERRNVFNFLNRTLGNNSNGTEVSTVTSVSVKQSTSKDLNIEQFKITEDTKKIERDILKLNSSMVKYPPGSNGFRSINAQIAEKNKELVMLKNREQQIAKEQKQRKDKQKMTVF